MPKTVVLDKMYIENVQLFRRAIEVDTGELDEAGQPMKVLQVDWKLAINYTMSNSEGVKQGGTKIFNLSEAQQTNVKSFLKPFATELKAEIDIQDGEDWTEE